MIFLLVAAASLSAQQAPPADGGASIRDASLAIAAGRLEEAKLIIARAISQGVQGPAIDRLTADLAFASGMAAFMVVEWFSGHNFVV